MFAAHWEAMLVLLQDDLAAGRLLSKHTRIREAGHLAVFAAAAVEAVPLLATDPRLAQVLKLCFAVLLRVSCAAPPMLCCRHSCMRVLFVLPSPDAPLARRAGCCTMPYPCCWGCVPCLHLRLRPAAWVCGRLAMYVRHAPGALLARTSLPTCLLILPARQARRLSNRSNAR